MADGRYLLHSYYNLLNHHEKPLKCQFCFKLFSAEDLECHFFSDHRYRFPSLNSCPWCAGIHSWKNPRQKYRHARHLLDCFKRYRNRCKWINNSCTAPREFYGRPILPDAHIYAYESVFLPPLHGRVDWWDKKEEVEKKQLFVESDDLGISYIRKFIHFEESPVVWFHLVVRAYALAEFFERFENYWEHNQAFLLEFSCWCDGGEFHDDPFHRHHRHMIALTRNGKDFYENCWKKFEVTTAERYKMCRPIQSWVQLKNTLFCLSSRKASCSFTLGFVQQHHQRISSCHFYIFRPLSSDFKWRAALALDGAEGIQEAISSSRRHMPVTPFASKCTLGPRRQWRVKIGDVMDSLNLPAKKDWWWYPPRKQQLILDEVVPLVKEIESLKRKRKEIIPQLKKQFEELKIEIENIRRKL